MDFFLNSNTKIVYESKSKAVLNAVEILKRDIVKKFVKSGINENKIVLKEDKSKEIEEFELNVGEDMVISASDELGFVYGLLYISEKFLGIKPFWFWLDQKINRVESIGVKCGVYTSPKPAVKYRGWFVNDEVLIMKWNIGGDETAPWKMVFESLLRCGGNMVIPGTDKNSKIYNKIASDMGLWITHHHAEPLGAEMFARAYPGQSANYAEAPELFYKLWEDAVKAQKDMKVIWCLGFRGQGDYPFWYSDTSGRFDTSQKRGKLISDIIELQRQIVLKYVENPVFCTNLYGEIMELYDEGHIHFDDEIIKVSADNGYGKMVTRRRDGHTVRISSMPKVPVEHGGIYYHVSFYDLQAASHVTMLPNSIDFVNRELDEVMEKNVTDFWIINCSNVRPHAYHLDAIRKKWYGENVSDERHSEEFVKEYYGGETEIAAVYRDYHKAMLAYGSEEDEHAGEQIYNENIRLLIHAFFNGRKEGTPGLKWLVGQESLNDQVDKFTALVGGNYENIKSFYENCIKVSESLNGEVKELFDATILLQVKIHFFSTIGVMKFGEAYKKYLDNDFWGAFMDFGYSAENFDTANRVMRESEYGVWSGYYMNECFADMKHTAYMIKKMMGVMRERGDNARHDKWYRDVIYAPEDRDIMTLLVNDNHMTDDELFEEFKVVGRYKK